MRTEEIIVWIQWILSFFCVASHEKIKACGYNFKIFMSESYSLSRMEVLEQKKYRRHLRKIKIKIIIRPQSPIKYQ